MFVVGVTGGIATGKSTVLQIFKENGIAVIDADQIARDIIEPEQSAWKLIRKEFGDEILLEDGRINRAMLGSIVFNNPGKRKKLNDITHPRIQFTLAKMTIQKLIEGHSFIVMELPLLFETGRMMSFMHKIITVICDGDQQLERLCQRNSFPIEIAQQRIDTQMPLDIKAANSQFIIYNNGTIEATRDQTERIIAYLKTSKFHWYLRFGVGFSILGLSCLSYYVYTIL